MPWRAEKTMLPRMWFTLTAAQGDQDVVKFRDLVEQSMKPALIIEAQKPAREVEAKAETIAGVMRTLASLGLFTEDPSHRFSLTPLGEVLRTGTPGSVRSPVLTLAGELVTKSLDHLHYSVETGKSGFEKAVGMPLFIPSTITASSPWRRRQSRAGPETPAARPCETTHRSRLVRMSTRLIF